MTWTDEKHRYARTGIGHCDHKGLLLDALDEIERLNQERARYAPTSQNIERIWEGIKDKTFYGHWYGKQVIQEALVFAIEMNEESKS